MANSYQIAVKTAGSSEYTKNGVYLPTVEQANLYGKVIASRWTAYIDHHVLESDQKPNYFCTETGLQPITVAPISVARTPPVKRRQYMKRKKNHNLG